MIVFVRHGETAANRERLALGRADPSLTERGRAQAEAVAGRLAGSNPAVVLTSPLLRARETADAIAAASGALVRIDARLVELDYGEWDGLRFSEMPPDALARWRTDPTFAPPGGESLQAVSERVDAFCSEHADGPTVVAVSHVSPIKAGVAWALGASEEIAWRMFLDLASITRITAAEGRPSLLGFNDTSHLS